MPGGSARIEEVFNAAAEALVLVDLADVDSINDLAAGIDAVADLFPSEADADHPVARCLDAVRALEAGDQTALSDLARAFDEARRLATEPREQDREAPAAAGVVMPLSADDELVRDFAIRAVEHLDDADQRLLDMENRSAGPDAVDAAFRAFHTIKGMAGFLAFDDISDESHRAESLLATAREQQVQPDGDTLQELFGAVDRLRGLVAIAAPGVVTPGGTRAVAESGPTDGSGRSVAEAAAPAPTLARETSVRIDERRLDALLDTIGELVISESMVSSAVRAGEAEGLEARLERLDKITRELQHMATSLRMVPMRATFRRMARLVRDLAYKAGKPIELVLLGEDIELDKTVVDSIQDPLVHALRNAVDHGIESADERRAAGKPETARITMSAYHLGGAIHIDVADDGRGISLDAVRARAARAGLFAEAATPSDADLLDLVFEPGFSTAEQVTDLSGRGVGMDVVKRTVEQLRGHVQLTSDPGRGTTLSVRLPVTLAIIDGMVCRVGGERFIVPVLSIERSVRPKREELHSVSGRGRMLETDDGFVPVIALHELLGVEGAVIDPAEGVVVIVDEGARRAGLFVCELLGQQQTVIKPLGEGLDSQPGLAGGAIMSDGRVGLILDAPGLVRLAHGRE